MKSNKFIACCFVEVPKDDVFFNYEFKDSLGRSHVVVGKRCDWLYITDGDRIFTKNQLLRIKSGVLFLLRWCLILSRKTKSN